VQTEQVKSIGGDLAAFAIAQGVTRVFDFVAITCPNAAVPQFGKGLQQIGLLTLTSSGVKFPADLTEELEAAVGVQAIEKGTALDIVLENLLLLLEKVPPAASLAEGAQEAQAEEFTVGDARALAHEA
jgi:hypothetical protein